VLTRTAEIGQIAVPGTTVLFRLARDGQVEMRGQVAEQDLPKLKIGQQAQVRLDGLAKAFTGEVWQVGAIIDPTTRQGSVRIALPSDNTDLRPGAFARAELRVDSVTGVLLPQTAVLSDESGNYVLVVDADNKVQRRGVTVAGARSEGLLVSAGLAGTERVIAIAGAFLRMGEAVAIAKPAS
jgi:HlyD family secretion protein